MCFCIASVAKLRFASVLINLNTSKKSLDKKFDRISVSSQNYYLVSSHDLSANEKETNIPAVQLFAENR